MSGKKSKQGKKAPLSNPEQGGGKQSKQDANIHVHGTVETYPPQRLLEKHDTERNEDSAQHIAERKEDGIRETKKLFWEKLMFYAVAAYAFAAFWQVFLMNKTVKVTQENFVKDQRAWISVDVPSFSAPDAPTITVNMRITDTGKTVAKNVNGDFVATILNRGEVPALDQYGVGHPHNRIYVQGIHPNAVPPLETTIPVVRYGAMSEEPIPNTKELREKVASGESYIVFFGKLTYCDVFHVKHWTKFCTGVGKMSGLKECIGYNDVDTEVIPTTDCP